MRRKPSGNGGYSNQRRGRGGPQNSSGGGGNRPRRNYGAAREKYLVQARDALAAGDRVLAENYYQHAEHCYRMLAEEGANNPRPQQSNSDNDKSAKPANASKRIANDSQENSAESNDNDGEGLPAFITSTAFPTMDEEMAKDPVIVDAPEE